MKCFKMNEVSKSLVLEFLFPVNAIGHVPYDDENHYKRIEEKCVLSTTILDAVQRQNIISTTLYLEHFKVYSKRNGKDILVDAQWLWHYLKKGNKLNGYLFELLRPFCSKELRKRFYIIDCFYYRGKPCNTLLAIEKLIEIYSTVLKVEQAAGIWNIPLPRGIALIDSYYLLKQVNLCAKELLEAYRKGDSVINYLFSKDLI
jgi:hypothetical protein